MEADSVPTNWRVTRLAELGEVNRGRSRHRPRYAEHLYGGSYPFIQTGDIKASGGKITSYSQTYSDAGLAQSRLWPVGTMCITIAANIAETAILTLQACFPDSVVGFVADESKCDVRFVEYMFRRLRAQIQFEATGSVQDNINLETLGRLSFPLPPLPEQKAIAHILGTLDDKIELNRRMNETLEAMARTIFKSWFVDFDPVRTKSEGRQPFGMNAETAALFPHSFQDSSLGRIPTGWRTAKLDEMIDIRSGGTPKTSVSEYWAGEIPWFSVVDTPQPSDVFVIQTEKSITKSGVENSATEVLPFGTTIISARGTVGNLAVTGMPMAMNQSCYGIRGGAGFGDYFTYFNLKSKVSELAQSTHGTVFDTITRDTFKIIDCTVPSAELTQNFDHTVRPFLRRILLNLFESNTLRQTRDALLPKLISGEIRVKVPE